MRVAVVIPALDEAASLPGVLEALPGGLDIVVVDNGSTDGTADVARAFGVRVVSEPRRGYGTAVLAGMSALCAAPPDMLVILDADHADRPELVHILTDPIRTDRADLVLSDRTRTAERGALTTTQRFGNRLATTLIGWTTGHRYRDMGPFRAVRWSTLTALRMRDPTWGWNVEMQMKAVRLGFRVLEVPMPYRARTRGRSKISGTLSGSARAGARILLAVHRYRREP